MARRGCRSPWRRTTCRTVAWSGQREMSSIFRSRSGCFGRRTAVTAPPTNCGTDCPKVSALGSSAIRRNENRCAAACDKSENLGRTLLRFHQFDEASELLVDPPKLEGRELARIGDPLLRALRLIMPDQRHEVCAEEGIVACAYCVVGHRVSPLLPTVHPE